MKLTTNFSLNEFQRNGNKIPEPLMKNIQQLANELQIIRDTVRRPIKIISGYRTPEYNKLVGGALNSMHLQAKAADIKIEGLTPYEISRVLDLLIKIKILHDGGIGIYKTFVHYDIGKSRRW